MKRVLIIVYYWPPSGGSGVQRWVKFVKHLRCFGWEPVIYTPLNPFVTEYDETLLKEIPNGIEVIRQPVFEITKYFGAPTSSTNSNTKGSSILGKAKKAIGSFVRGNFFIPDPRITWLNPSVKFLSSYLKQNKIDAIVSSGPPNSMHLIAEKIKLKFNIPWLADFRDPWMEVLKFHDFNISHFAMQKHQQLFLNVLKNADSIVVAHPSVKSNFSKLTATPVQVITNGYDTEDLKHAVDLKLNREKFKIVFIGILYDALNSTSFWQAVAELIQENATFKAKVELIFVGKVKDAALKDLEENNLMPYTLFTGYVNHSVAVSYEKAADIVLLFTPSADEFKYIIPGKLFEYLGVRKPILCVAPLQNDSAQIVQNTASGFVVNPISVQEIKQALFKLFLSFEEGNLQVSSIDVEQYERLNLTQKLVNELDRMTGNKPV